MIYNKNNKVDNKLEREEKEIENDGNTNKDEETWWGYIRVSTDLQDIEKQRDIIKNWFRNRRIKKDRYEIIEGGRISSTKSKRERKLGFIENLMKGDVLVCTEISRLSRSVSELLEIVDDLIRRGVRVEFISHNLSFSDFSNPFTKFALQMLSAFAEMERNICSQRTKNALRILKGRGIRLGKPVGTIQHSIFDNHRKKIEEWCRNGFSYSSQARALGLSHVGLIYYIRTRKIYRGRLA